MAVPQCRLASGGIVDDLVGMSHEVESSGRDHPHQFVEIVRNQLAQVVAEMKAQVFCKRLRVGVYVDIFPAGLDQVHRSDPVVQRQPLKVVRSRVALFVQVVDFESGVQFDPIRVCGFQPVDFRKVGRHPFRFQRPAGRERERCVRRDSVSGESLPARPPRRNPPSELSRRRTSNGCGSWCGCSVCR